MGTIISIIIGAAAALIVVGVIIAHFVGKSKGKTGCSGCSGCTSCKDCDSGANISHKK